MPAVARRKIYHLTTSTVMGQSSAKRCTVTDGTEATGSTYGCDGTVTRLATRYSVAAVITARLRLTAASSYIAV